MSTIMAHVLVSGHVQGVFFRGYVQRRANALGMGRSRRCSKETKPRSTS